MRWFPTTAAADAVLYTPETAGSSPTEKRQPPVQICRTCKLTQRLVDILHDLLIRLRRALRCQRHNSFPRLLLLVVPAILVLAQEEVHDLDDDAREVRRSRDYLREEVCGEGVGARAIASFEKGAEEGRAVVLLENEAR